MKSQKREANRLSVRNSNGRAIGLDIGSTAVRASVLKLGDGKGSPPARLHRSAEIGLEAGVVVNGEIREPGVVTRALKELWARNKFDCRNVVLGMANTQVMVRDLTVPNLDPERRAKALPYQAREVIALPIEEVVLDFCQLSAPDPTADTVAGLLVATPREPVLTAVRAVEKANLRVARVDLSSFGLVRALADPRPTIELLVDLGANLSTLVIHDRGVPMLVRTLGRGGEDLTKSLADRLDLPAVEAERVKREAGLQHGDPEIVRALTDGLRPLLAEIRTSVGYYRAASQGRGPLEQILLTGGAAQLRGIDAAMTEQIGLPTRVANPMQHVQPPKSGRTRAGDMPGFVPSAVSLGLAMGAAA